MSWVFWRGPLLVLVVLGCTMSLVTLRSLSAWLVLSSMAGWAYLPLAEVVSLIAVRRTLRKPVDLASLVDRFFAGFTPWFVWLIAFSTFWSSAHVAGGFSSVFLAWEVALAVVIAWSCYTDLRFFRSVSDAPVRSLCLQRAISWALIVAVFVGGSAPAHVIGMLGL